MSNPSQQPISFKTVPGRNRTQKWTEAKTNKYDGDDWGGYDDYDDYGYDEPSASRQGSGQYGQQLQRQSSFDRGVDAERRQFSSGSAAHTQERHTSPVASGGRVSQDNASPDEARRRMREFSNPGQVPQPLNTPRSPEAPESVERPPRKSSLSSMSPPPDARPIPAATSPSADKPLPFIRPSDIYKRMAEEQQKERQSLESGRPSLEAVQHDAGSPSLAQHGLAHKRSQDNLSPKPTSPESSFHGAQDPSVLPMHIAQPTVPASTDSSQGHFNPQETSPRLPPVSRTSDFGSFMPRNEEEARVSATGLEASTAAANAAASALASGSRDITPAMPAHQFQAQSNDPAAEIAAESTSDAPVENVGRTAGEDPSGLSHQHSSGFRSVVHRAFDSQDNGSTPSSPISRDNTQSVVSRSDTNSTRSISPIMSRVPSAATAQQKQQERDIAVPPIAEETPLEVARSRPSADGSNSGISSRQSILRKPTPSHSRNVSSEVASFTPGYRRSIETPSPNNSPARTPGIEDANTRRFSGPMAAETVNNPEAPDVSSEAPEMPSATLEPVETPLETSDPTNAVPATSETVVPLSATRRGRSGTDYSVRESDLAREANTSPEQRESVAEAISNSQKLFLDTHPSNPSSPTALSPTSGIVRSFPHPATSGSGRSSPAGLNRSRVRNIVDQYHQIDEDSRRNSAASGMSSKSSWSNFGAEEDHPPGPVRRTTGGPMLSQNTPGSPLDGGMFPSYDRAGSDAALGSSAVPAASSPLRPEAERQESFRPHLPGEWISATATPASEVPEDPVSRGHDHTSRDITPASPPTPRGQHDEEIDLTPTTRKTKLRESDPSMDADNREDPVAAAKNAGDALGTALMSHSGYGHQTQDFASQETAAPVEIPEMQPHRETGNIEGLAKPYLTREQSDAPSDSTSSVANSIPPSPPKNITQSPGLSANTVASQGRPISNYFAGYGPDAPAPLSFARNSPNTTHDFESNRPAMIPALSTDTTAADYESDRLRKDIVRSLGPEQMARLKQESADEDVQRTETALDAPTNERRVESGDSALPPAEIQTSNTRSGLPSQSRAGLLGKRFSWENKSADGDDLDHHMAAVGETKGDENRESYGRPDSNQGLHVVNTEVIADSEPTTAEEKPSFMLNEPADAEKRLSTSLPIGTEALALSAESTAVLDRAPASIAENQGSAKGGLDQVAPLPMVDDDNESASRDPASPTVPLKDESPAATSTPASAQQSASVAQGKIPAFRDLAAIKSTPDRIAAYESTRHRFADMNTGLNGWLSGMLTAHPEYSNAGNQKYEGPAAIQTTGLGNTISGLGGTIRSHGHKHSPSILKIGGGERKASTTSTTAAAPESGSGSGGGHVDVEKMQAKGKDFMKSAGAGAKGLFAKGKSRFGRGGEKVE